MNIQDPISDMLTIIRNGQFSRKKNVLIFFSKIKLSIINILKEEGFIINYNLINKDSKFIKVFLKYFNKNPVIYEIKRISKPSLRIYSKKNINNYKSCFGILIISTSKGIMTDKFARKLNLGGEIICFVS